MDVDQLMRQMCSKDMIAEIHKYLRFDILDLCRLVLPPECSDINQYIIDKHDERYLSDTDLHEMLPGAYDICRVDDYNLCYQGRECTAYAKHLYKYKTYYLILEFNVKGNNRQVLSLGTHYMGDVEFYKDCVKVIHESVFNWRTFLGKYWIRHDLPYLTRFFKNMWSNETHAQQKQRFLGYCADQF